MKEVRQEDDDAKVMMYIIEQIPFYQFLHGLLLFNIVSSAELPLICTLWSYRLSQAVYYVFV